MNKSEIIRAYKKTQRTMGIYRIKNHQNDVILIGFATDLNARFNRHKAELKFGNHRNKELQNLWDSLGESNFEFEILDVLDPKEDTQANYNEDLRILAEMWVQKLSKAGDSVLYLKN